MGEQNPGWDDISAAIGIITGALLGMIVWGGFFGVLMTIHQFGGF